MERKTPIDFRVKRLKVTWPLTYFWKTLTLAITVLSLEIGLSYLACTFLMARPFQCHHLFEHVTLTLTFDLLLINFIISQNFFILRDKAFIFGKCVPYDKAFPMVTQSFNVLPWPWSLNYFLCRLRSIATHRDHFVCPSLSVRHCLSVCHTFLSLFPKLCFAGNAFIPRNAATILNISLHFLTVRYWAFIFGICVSYVHTFPMVPYILNMWPWLWTLTFFCKGLTLPPQTYTMPCGALPDFVSILVQNFRSKSLGQKIWYSVKGLIPMNALVK